MAPYYSPPNLGVAIAIYFHYGVSVKSITLYNMPQKMTRKSTVPTGAVCYRFVETTSGVTN